MTSTTDAAPRIVVPCLRTAIRHAAPNVFLGKIVPLLVFLAALRLVGQVLALLMALVWSIGLVLVRRRADRRVPGIVLLGLVTLSARTIAALVTGSMVVYFVQPTITTALVGVAFLVSVLLGTPLAGRLVGDVIPIDDETGSHPLVERFFVRLSVIWSACSLVNVAITIWLLTTASITTFVVAKALLGPLTGIVAVAGALWWFRRRVALDGVSVVWGGDRRLAVDGPAP